jgi:hypothetical protein
LFTPIELTEQFLNDSSLRTVRMFITKECASPFG